MNTKGISKRRKEMSVYKQKCLKRKTVQKFNNAVQNMNKDIIVILEEMIHEASTIITNQEWMEKYEHNYKAKAQTISNRGRYCS